MKTDTSPHTPEAARVAIHMDKREAEDCQQGMADLLCWMRGFASCLYLMDRGDLVPMGLDEAQRMNVLLKGALDDANEKRGPAA